MEIPPELMTAIIAVVGSFTYTLYTRRDETVRRTMLIVASSSVAAVLAAESIVEWRGWDGSHAIRLTTFACALAASPILKAACAALESEGGRLFVATVKRALGMKDDEPKAPPQLP